MIIHFLKNHVFIYFILYHVTEFQAAPLECRWYVTSIHNIALMSNTVHDVLEVMPTLEDVNIKCTSDNE
jgi:hypothetical protein